MIRAKKRAKWAIGDIAAYSNPGTDSMIPVRIVSIQDGRELLEPAAGHAFRFWREDGAKLRNSPPWLKEQWKRNSGS